MTGRESLTMEFGRRSRDLAAAVSFVVCASGVALAQTPAASPAFTGWRIGAGVGGSFAAHGMTNTATFGGTPLGPFSDKRTNVSAGQPFGTVRAGYDFRAGGNFVAGFEGNFEFGGRSSISGRSSLSGTETRLVTLCCVDTATYSISQDASRALTPLGSLRARAGWLVSPDTLLFATAGVSVAWSRSRLLQSGSYGGVFVDRVSFAPPVPFSGTFPTQAVERRFLSIAPLVGAGIEYALDARWSIRGEYTVALHRGAGLSAPVVTGDPSVGLGKPTFSGAMSARSALHSLLAGVDYRF